MTIVDFKPKGKRKTITLENAFQQIKDAGAKNVLVFAEHPDGASYLVFNTDNLSSRDMLWLLEQVKILVTNGDMLADP